MRNSAMRTSSTLAAFKISAILTASLVLGTTLGCHRDPNVQKQKYLESGKRYVEAGKYKEATIQFANALKVDRNFAEAHYQLGKMYLKTGSGMPAYAELSRAVQLQPNNVQARIDLGNLLIVGHQPDLAAAQANAVLAINPNNADAYALLATVSATKNDRASALAQIQKALSIEPNRAAFHATLGLIQATDPSTSADAEAQLRKAVSLDPSSVNAHLVLASLLARKGDMAGAEAEDKAAIAADPKNITARTSLAQLYFNQKDLGKAEATLHQAAEDLGDTTQGADLLQNFYVGTHQLDRSESVYADLVAKHPKSAPLKVVYARILISKKEQAKARTIVDELMKSDGSNPDVAVLNGILLLNDHKPGDAVDALQKAAKNNPENLDVKIWLARAAEAKGDMTLAQQSLQDAAKISPQEPRGQGRSRPDRHPASRLRPAVPACRTDHASRPPVGNALHLARYGGGQSEEL
jgi:Tfp pilus assembly protein PilF